MVYERIGQKNGDRHNNVIFSNTMFIKDRSDLGYLGYTAGENKFSYPALTEDKIRAFEEQLRLIADFVIVDCVSKVFDGDIDCETLEDVYTKFNIDLPTGYRGRSLSKSDIVEVENKNGVERSFWFCDSFGFAEVGFEPELTQDAIKGTMISVLLVEPGKYPRMVEIDRGLESLQEQVEGDIEQYSPFYDEVSIVCNEEGKMRGMTLNRAIYDEDSHQMVDIIAGKFLVVYAPSGSEHYQSLPPELADKYAKKFKQPERFFKMNGEIIAVPFDPKKSRDDR